MSSSAESRLLTTQRIRSASEPEFSRLASIYQASLPASEQKPIESLALMVEIPNYLFLVVKEKGSVIGFSIALCFANSNACLLEYMAVAQTHRGQGIGAYLFAQTAQRPEIAERYLLLEVDSDKVLAQASLDESRRKIFYRRFGCRELEGLSYIMPPVSTAEQPPAMELLIYKRNLPESVKKSCVQQWLQCCYTQVYHQPADDSRIAVMLKQLPDKIRLV